jgi:hypothetical protein
MEIPILIEPIAGNGYRARGELLALSADGPTPEAALARLKELLQARANAGVSIVPLQVGLPRSPHRSGGSNYANGDRRQGDKLCLSHK